MRKQDRSTIGWGSLALVVPPVLVFIGSDLLLGLFGWYGITAMPMAAPPPGGHIDAAGRLYILAALLASCGVSSLTLLLFARDLAEEFGSAMRRLLLATLLTGLVIGALWMTVFGRFSGALVAPLGTDVIEATVRLFARTTQNGRPEPETIARFAALVFVGRAVLMFGAALTIVGAVSCLARPLPPVSLAEARAFLLRQHLRLRLYVNAAAALMVAAIAFQLAWTRWPQALFATPGAKAFSAHVDAYALYSGVTFSLVIATFAIPVVAGLRAQGLALVAEGEASADAAPLLAPGLVDSLGKVLVVLAPALAGILPMIADLLQLRS